MLYKITAPNRGYNGITAGVLFQAGIGHTEDEKNLNWFCSKGYDVEEMDNQPFVVEGKEIGKVEGEYITITDEETIRETLGDTETEVEPEAPAETSSDETEVEPEAPAKKPRGKKE